MGKQKALNSTLSDGPMVQWYGYFWHQTNELIAFPETRLSTGISVHNVPLFACAVEVPEKTPAVIQHVIGQDASSLHSVQSSHVRGGQGIGQAHA